MFNYVMVWTVLFESIYLQIQKQFIVIYCFKIVSLILFAIVLITGLSYLQGSIDIKEKRTTEERKSSAEVIVIMGGEKEGGGESEKLSLDENGERSSETVRQKLVEAAVADISSSSDEENAVANPPATETAHNFLFQVVTH